uniref:Uncharacterized protein n=1 Tax=Anguilla anguilla TaxID=7936 RepID=A0A0E9P5I3_ANGAN
MCRPLNCQILCRPITSRSIWYKLEIYFKKTLINRPKAECRIQ